MNRGDLKEEIESAAIAAFLQVRRDHPQQKFCGYALYSDPDAVTVCPSINSVENLHAKIADDPDEAIYYKWSPGEWDHEFEGAEHFSALSTRLRAQAQGINDPARYQEFRNWVYETCVLAMQSLALRGCFEDLVAGGVVVFSIAGGAHSDEPAWIARLNEASLAQEFAAWIGTP
jgi:hypothetical protein